MKRIHVLSLALAAVITSPINTSFASSSLSPALQTVIDISQTEFRGYKPGNKEMRSRIKKAGKFTSADEVEAIMNGQIKDWAVVDIRNAKQGAGGYIQVGDARMLRVGRLKPTSIMEDIMMTIEDKKTITQAAPKNIVIMCRSGMKSSFDYASYAAAGFNDVKIFGVLDWVKSCRPLRTETNILDAGIKKKGYPMVEREPGVYYWEKCAQ